MVSGISTPNSSTIQFTLTSAISDFLYMMAMPFDSARPVEYDSYVPNSLQLDQNTLSDGPYKISSYIPGKSVTLGRGRLWNQLGVTCHMALTTVLCFNGDNHGFVIGNGSYRSF